MLNKPRSDHDGADSPAEPYLAAADTMDASEPGSLPTFSHQFRSTLHTLLGFTRLLQINARDEVLEQLEVVESCGNNLLKLIDDFVEANQSSSLSALSGPSRSLLTESSNVTPVALLPLPGPELQVFQDLLRAGRLTRLREWALGLIDSHPEHAKAAHSVLRLTRGADIGGLERMLDQWLGLSSQETSPHKGP